jgi:hypothetical protein
MRLLAVIAHGCLDDSVHFVGLLEHSLVSEAGAQHLRVLQASFR